MNSKNMNLGSVANKQLAIKLEFARDRYSDVSGSQHQC